MSDIMARAAANAALKAKQDAEALIPAAADLIRDQVSDDADRVEDAVAAFVDSWTPGSAEPYPSFRTDDGRILMYFDPATGEVDFLPSGTLIDRIGRSPFVSEPGSATTFELRTEDGRLLAWWDAAGGFDTLVSDNLAARIGAMPGASAWTFTDEALA